MRQTLAGEPDIDQYFQKLVITAQGTFNAAGFNPSAVNQIALYKQEIVQKVGSSIFAAYLRKLGLCYGMAIVVILCATFGLDRLVKSGIQSGAVTKVSAATANEDTKNGKKLGPVSVYESPGVLRWDATFSIVHTGILVASGLVGLFFAGCARAMDITFERLLVPNEDLLAPWIRLFLFGIPILVLGVMFEQGWMTVAIGEKFSTAVINQNLVAAVIIGILLGVLERLLPQELFRKAKTIFPQS
jgi:hypothetical protein